MNFWRAILASLFSLVCTVAISLFITLATLQTTLLDRQEIKGWLQHSGIYNTALSDALRTDQAVQQQTGASSSFITQDTVKTILGKTFTPSYIAQSAEKVIDGTYNWLDGKQPTINFSINTTTYRDAFVDNATAVLQQQLMALPACTHVSQFNAENPTCLPPGTNVAQVARSLATDASNELSIFQQPITNQTLAQASDNSAQNNDSPLTSASSPAQKIPDITAKARMWLWLRPLIAVVSGGLMVLLSHNRLKAGKHLAGRVFIGTCITMIAGLLIAYFGSNLKLGSFISGNSTLVGTIFEPILHQALPAIGSKLALVSGIVATIAGGAWIALRIIKKRVEHAALLMPGSTPAPKPDLPRSPDSHSSAAS
jgi:hypothetical protein